MYTLLARASMYKRNETVEFYSLAGAIAFIMFQNNYKLILKFSL